MVPSDHEPDRLSAALAELEAVRRVPGWVPAPPDRSGSQRTVRRRRSRRAGRRPDLPPVEAWRASNGRLPESPAARTRAERHDRGPAPARLPAALHGASVAPGRWAVLGIAAVVLVAVALFAARTLLAQAASAPRPIAAAVDTAETGSTAAAKSTAVGGSASGPVTGPTTGAGSSSAAGGTIEVHVLGQVRSPGVVSVPVGARVLDVVQAAGGLLPGADPAQVNLARKVQDGEQIVVPRPGEHPVTAAAGPSTPAANGSTAGGDPVDLNTADAAALDSLPGVGPVLAQRIVLYRTDNGPFRSVDQLDEVSGIGAKLMDQLRPLVRV